MVTVGGGGVLVRRLAAVVGLALAGAVAAMLLGAHDIARTPSFFLIASALLAVGLFASTSAIDLDLLRDQWRTVLVAVTVGVLIKAALIGAVLYAAFGKPEYLLLGVVMAQIDPLSVAALDRSTRLSDRGRTLLAAWSSFDDPVTTVLVIVLAGMVGHSGATGAGKDTAAGLPNPLAGVWGNALLAVAMGVVWLLLRRFRPGERRTRPFRAWQAVAVFFLMGFGVVAVGQFLMLGLAVAGLFYRPRIAERLSQVTGVAFAAATVVLGLVLGGGINVGVGAVLGLAAYAAQVVVGAAITWRLQGDRLRLSLSQQAGITSVILALLLEPSFPGTVAIVGPAILVVNLLHVVANMAVERWFPPTLVPAEARRGAQPRMTPRTSSASS
jgi:Sodium/hydrogen exchanger family